MKQSTQAKEIETVVQLESEAESDTEQDDSRMEIDHGESSDLSESSFDNEEDSFCSDDDDEDVEKYADELSKNYIRYFQILSFHTLVELLLSLPFLTWGIFKIHLLALACNFLYISVS